MFDPWINEAIDSIDNEVEADNQHSVKNYDPHDKCIIPVESPLNKIYALASKPKY